MHGDATAAAKWGGVLRVGSRHKLTGRYDDDGIMGGFFLPVSRRQQLAVGLRSECEWDEVIVGTLVVGILARHAANGSH